MLHASEPLRLIVKIYFQWCVIHCKLSPCRLWRISPATDQPSITIARPPIISATYQRSHLTAKPPISPAFSKSGLLYAQPCIIAATFLPSNLEVQPPTSQAIYQPSHLPAKPTIRPAIDHLGHFSGQLLISYADIHCK
jgi:hypothetical protein